jgi:hypothetical protein
MKRQLRWYRLSLLSVVIATMLVSCKQVESPSIKLPETPVPLTIECHTSYRASVTVSIERRDTVLLTKSESQKTIAYQDLVFHATYWDDPYEGRSFKTSVTVSNSNNEIQADLYQMSRTTLPENQFYELGFTGLVYVYHPTSRAEVQYSCAAK